MRSASKVFNLKLFLKVKNTKGQALLLVTISSLIFLVIVLAVLDRTNRQITIQKQNAEYIFAFNRVLAATDSVAAIINSGVAPYTPTGGDNSAAINALINPSTGNSLIPCNDPNAADGSCNEYKVTVDPYDPAKEIPTQVASDQSITLTPFNKSNQSPTGTSSNIQSFIVYCDITKNNTAVNIQVLYRDSGNNLQTEAFATTCKETSSQINGGTNWSYGGSQSSPFVISDSGFSVYTTGQQVIGATTYQKLVYNVPSAKKNIVSIRVMPKVGFNNSASTATSTLIRMYSSADAVGSILGTSNPVTGVAIGYGKNSRTSTIKFSIPSTVKLPSFFDYVLFEGGN